MALTKIAQTTYTDMTNAVTDYTQDPATDTGVSGSGETTYQASWTTWLGYYQKIPELCAIIDRKAIWTVGSGFKTKKETKKILGRIKGFGKENFNTILSNAVRVYTINGDFFAEIVRDKAGRLINLKALNPGSIKIVANSNGLITRYEQFARAKKIGTYKKEQIFHLAWNRIADEIHGQSTIEKLEDVLTMRQESMNDLRKVFHRYVKPLIIWEVDTDDATEIAAFKAKQDAAVENGENVIIPKGAASYQMHGIPQYSTLDPLPWLKYLEQMFILAEGVPEVILGGGEKRTEAESKILYLAYEQLVKWNQLFLENEIKNQLGIEIKFKFPASIAPELINDQKKDPNMNKESVDPNKETK